MPVFDVVEHDGHPMAVIDAPQQAGSRNRRWQGRRDPALPTMQRRRVHVLVRADGLHERACALRRPHPIRRTGRETAGLRDRLHDRTAHDPLDLDVDSILRECCSHTRLHPELVTGLLPNVLPCTRFLPAQDLEQSPRPPAGCRGLGAALGWAGIARGRAWAGRASDLRRLPGS